MISAFFRNKAFCKVGFFFRITRKKVLRPRKREKLFTPCKVVFVLFIFHFYYADNFAPGQYKRVCHGT